MKRILFVCLWMFYTGFQGIGQSYCQKDTLVNKDIAILKSSILKTNSFISRAKIHVCYQNTSQVVYTLTVNYRLNGENATEKDIEKYNQQLFLLSVEPVGDQFNLDTRLDATTPLVNGDQVFLSSNKDVFWNDFVLKTKFEFLYSIKGETKTDEVLVEMKLPDNAPFEDDSPEGTDQEVGINDSQELDSLKSENQPKSNQKMLNNKAILDSIIFYYTRMGGLINLVNSKINAGGTELIEFNGEVEKIKMKFDQHVELSDRTITISNYIEQFNRLYSAINKMTGVSEINQVTNNGSITSSKLRSSEDNAKEDKSSDGISVSSQTENLIIYIILSVIGISVLGFLFFKFRK